MNYELLEKVKQHILDEPNRLIMSLEIHTGKKMSDSLDGYADTSTMVCVEPPCGTAGCIAGWTVILGHPECKPNDVFAKYCILQEARALLRLGISEMDSLYYTTRWPEDLRKRFKTTDLKIRAEVAAEVIDRFVAKKREEETKHES